MTAMDVARRSQLLVTQDRVEDAYAILLSEARRGDPIALSELGLWFLSGQHVPRDLARARTLFDEAGKRGDKRSREVHINFVANGTGAPADWRGSLRLLRQFAEESPDAAAQLSLIDAMALDDVGTPTISWPVEAVSASPQVCVIRKTFSREECDYLIEAAGQMFQPAGVVDPRTGAFVRDRIRTSDLAAFPLLLETPVVHALNRRLAALAALPVTHGEPLQVLRYRPGQEYRLHSDALPGVSNQRTVTALAYLNDDYDGGETHFPKLDWSFRGEVGDVLIFHSVDADGRPDPLAVHAGLPVKRGEKLIASRWMRAHPIDLMKPLGA